MMDDINEKTSTDAGSESAQESQTAAVTEKIGTLRLIVSGPTRSMILMDPRNAQTKTMKFGTDLQTVAGDRAKVTVDTSQGNTVFVLTGTDAQAVFDDFKKQFGSVLSQTN